MLKMSISKILKRIQRKCGIKNAYIAAQDRWAADAASELDPRIPRGVPKAPIVRDRLAISAFKEATVEAEGLAEGIGGT